MSHKLLLSSGLVLAVSMAAHAQIGPGLSGMAPRYIITHPFDTTGAKTAPGTSIESVHHVKLSNNGDGEWTTALTNGQLEAAYGDDGASRGVTMGIFEPYTFNYTPIHEADALNSADDDIHLSLSPDGLHAVIERKDPLTGAHKGVWLSTRLAVGTNFPAPVSVSGFPTSTLTGSSLGEVHPYLGKVGGVLQCFYTDGDNIWMQPIDVQAATLTGQATVVATEVQGGAQPGAPSPMIGADGDVEALFATDIVSPRSGPGTGDADPTWHADLRASTPGVVRINRSDWQGWGGLAGGYLYFGHDSGGFHVMHAEAAVLLGDEEPPGGMADLTTHGVNWGSPQMLNGAILLGTGFGPHTTIPGIIHKYSLLSFAPMTIPTVTNTLDGVDAFSFRIPNIPSLSGISIPIQAVLVDQGPPVVAKWTNTAYLHIL